jgi:cyclohexanone monooxygenase
MLDEQARHVAYVVGRAVAEGIDAVEVTEEAEQAWVDEVFATARFGREYLESCTPGYYNNEGMVSELAVQNGFYGGGSIAFFKILDDWRTEGSMSGLALRRSADD